MRKRRLLFDDFCRLAVDFLTAQKTPYLVIGGLAVAAIGEPRMTRDVDVVAFVTLEQAEALIRAARRSGFEIAADELERLHETGTLRFGKSPFELDIILASLPFEAAARKRARRRKLFDRLVPLPTPEDLLVLKILAGRDKDLVDAVGIARRHLAKLDRAYVVRTLREVCELAEDTEALRRFDRVIEKATSDG